MLLTIERFQSNIVIKQLKIRQDNVVSIPTFGTSIERSILYLISEHRASSFFAAIIQ